MLKARLPVGRDGLRKVRDAVGRFIARGSRREQPHRTNPLSPLVSAKRQTLLVPSEGPAEAADFAKRSQLTECEV